MLPINVIHLFTSKPSLTVSPAKISMSGVKAIPISVTLPGALELDVNVEFCARKDPTAGEVTGIPTTRPKLLRTVRARPGVSFACANRGSFIPASAGTVIAKTEHDEISCSSISVSVKVVSAGPPQAARIR